MSQPNETVNPGTSRPPVVVVVVVPLLITNFGNEDSRSLPPGWIQQFDPKYVPPDPTQIEADLCFDSHKTW